MTSLISKFFTQAKPCRSMQIEMATLQKRLFFDLLPFNRYFIMVAGFFIQLCFGTMYTWSIYNSPIEKYVKENTTEPLSFDVSTTFLILVITFGFTSVLVGPLIVRYGPRTICIVGATMYFFGHLLCGLSIYTKFALGIWLSYGVIGGIGCSIGNPCSIIVLQRYFPDKRGLAAAIAVGGYGAGGALSIPLKYLMVNIKTAVYIHLIIFGVAYFVVQFLLCQFLSFPPADFNPAAILAPKKEETTSSSSSNSSNSNSVQADPAISFSQSPTTNGGQSGDGGCGEEEEGAAKTGESGADTPPSTLASTSLGGSCDNDDDDDDNDAGCLDKHRTSSTTALASKDLSQGSQPALSGGAGKRPTFAELMQAHLLSAYPVLTSIFRYPEFYLWMIVFPFNSMIGVYMFSVVNEFVKNAGVADDGQTDYVIAVASACSILGRLVLPIMAVRVKCGGMFLVSAVVVSASTYVLYLSWSFKSMPLFYAGMCVMSVFYGGGFAMAPGTITEIFGAQWLEYVFPFGYVIWSTMCVALILFKGLMKGTVYPDDNDKYQASIFYFIGSIKLVLLGCTCALVFCLFRRYKTVQRQCSQSTV